MALCVQTGWAGKCQHQGGLCMANNLMDGKGLALSHLQSNTHTLLVRLYLDSGRVLTDHVRNVAAHTNLYVPFQVPALPRRCCLHTRA